MHKCKVEQGDKNKGAVVPIHAYKCTMIVKFMNSSVVATEVMSFEPLDSEPSSQSESSDEDEDSLHSGSSSTTGLGFLQ